MDGQLCRCSICSRRFRDPKVLPCLHCFCRDCIENLRIPRRDAFHCPECHKDVNIPDNDVEKLPDAFPVYHKLELSRFVQKLESGEHGTCDTCSRTSLYAEAEAFCHSCGEHVCEGCIQKHKKEATLSDHRVVSYNELVKSADHSQHSEVLKKSRAASFKHFNDCSKHKKQKFIRYCYDCNELVCQDCIDTEHRQHKHDFITKATEKRKLELQDQLPIIRVLHKRIAGAVHSVRKTRSSIEDQKTSLSCFIDNEFDRLSRILERHKANLHTKLTQMANGKLDKLTVQQLELEGGSHELQRLTEFTEDSLETGTDKELLLLFKFLQERISDTVQRCSHVPAEPTEESNLAVKMSCESHLSNICRKNMLVYCTQADPSKCKVEGPGLKGTETFRTTQLVVRLFDKSEKLCKSPQDVSIEIKCLSTNTNVSSEVSNTGTGVYDVSYCPILRGQHDLSIFVNDQHIKGSPFTVHVHHPPLQLGKSQGIIDGVNAPRGIAINPEGNLLVTEWNGGRIVELDRNGKSLRSFGSGRDVMRKLHHPASIATDREGNIYVVDAAGEQHGLMKYDSGGMLLSAIGREGTGIGEFKNPRGMGFSNQEELYVCDRDNHRIQVFDTNLKFTCSIDINTLDGHLVHPSKPNDLTFDQAGNMYVTDYGNNAILCFSPTHQFLYAFSQQQGMAHTCLSGPECIHMDKNGYLYVTESKNHRVSVFRSNGGTLVTQFGRLGSGDSELKFPMGVVTDDNGFVYVCELFNHRVQVF